MEVQLRNEGEIQTFDSLVEAIKAAVGKKFDKISFTVEGENRLVLWSNEAWELRTPEGRYTSDSWDEVVTFSRWLPGEHEHSS